MTPAVITSLQNERIKAIRALDMRKVRRETGLFVAEGVSVLAMAREQAIAPATIVMLAGAAETGMARDVLASARSAGADIMEVSEAVLAKISAKDNPQTMLGVFQQRFAEPPNPATVTPNESWLALEEIRDPGNLGTIIRTAHAAGASGLILVGACCDPYSREAVRASMGSIFAARLVRMTHEAFVPFLAAWPGDSIATDLRAAHDFRARGARGPELIVMGSEGPGLSEAIGARCSRRVRIPMKGALDSLNLAVATALMLYEVRRDRL